MFMQIWDYQILTLKISLKFVGFIWQTCMFWLNQFFEGDELFIHVAETLGTVLIFIKN